MSRALSRPARLPLAALAAATVVAASVAGWATVAGSAPGRGIDRVALVDADTDKVVVPSVADGATLDLTSLGVRAPTLVAVPGGSVGSVRFTLDGTVAKTENYVPYAIAGDAAGGRDYLPWRWTAGAHELVVTPYAGRQAIGTAGTPLRLRFTLATGAAGTPQAPPSASPITPAPTTTTPAPTSPAPPGPAALPPTSGRYWYVSGSGTDGADGKTAATALRTPQRAADQVQPGDTVLIMDGTYAQSDPNQNVLQISRDGQPGKPITYAAYPGAKPVLTVRNWTGILVGASYVTVQGLTVRGNSPEITLAQAQAPGAQDDPAISGGGISVTMPWNQPNKHPHDVVIRGNTVSDCPGGGIYSVRADRLTFEDNTVFGNSKYSNWATSGISVYQAWNSDPSTGYKVVIRRNVVHDNENLLPFRFSNPDPAKRTITDGNGIIIDDARATQDFVAGKGAPYTGRFLVENNVVYRNGGRGVHVYSSDRVDVVNNTLFENSRSPAIKDGELTAFDAADVRFLGNAVLPAAGRPAVNTGNASGIVQTANVTGAAVRYADPGAANFRPAPGSAAIDAGANPLAPGADITGRSRPLGRAVDAGAYEVA